MDHQDAAPGRGDVFRLGAEADAAHFEPEVQPGAEHLVVVAGDVGHLDAALRVSEDQPQHLVVLLVPMPGFPQFPTVDDVADEIHPLAADATEEVGQEIAACAARAEMDVGDEDGPDHDRIGQRLGGENGVHATLPSMAR